MAVWYYARNNQQVGPLSLEQLQAMVRSGDLRAADRVWGEGMPDWAVVGAVPELQDVAGATVAGQPGLAGDVATLSYQSAPQYPSPRGRAKVTVILLWILFGLHLMMAVVFLLLASVSPRVGGAAIPPSAAYKLIVVGLFACGTALLFYGALIGCAIAFPMWMHRANRAARALGATGMEFTPGWAAGWFFVPFANLVMPYRVAVELWKAAIHISPRMVAGEQRPRRPSSGSGGGFGLVAAWSAWLEMCSSKD